MRRGASQLGNEGLLFPGPELLLSLVQPRFHAYSLAQVREDSDRSDRLAALQDQGRRKEHGNSGAILRHDLGSVAFEPSGAAVLLGVDETHDLHRMPLWVE